MLKNYAIILAAGQGSRFGADVPKQFIKVAGKTIFEHTLAIFQNNVQIDEIVVVINPAYRVLAENLLLKNNFSKVTHVVNGGDTRKESSYIGLQAISENEANVLIHDCARPFLTNKIIADCLTALEKYQAVDVAVPSADTIIEVENSLIKSIPKRSSLLRGQTPQCFKLSLIKHAHELTKNDENFTDDCGLIKKTQLAEVYVVEGSEENIKVTYQSDAYLADKLFQIRHLPITTDLSNFGKLKDKVIVVFGGSSGIGESIMKMATQFGAKMYSFSSRNHCDIRCYSDVEAALLQVLKHEKQIDCVINSAGILRMGKLEDRNIEDIALDFEVNYLGTINVAKAALSYLKQTKGALLLFASSSYTRGRALYSTYSSSKAGIVNLTQALAEEMADEGVRINVICPERTLTPMRERAFGKEPVASLLSADKVAEVTLQTALSSITGQVIDVRRNLD